MSPVIPHQYCHFPPPGYIVAGWTSSQQPGVYEATYTGSGYGDGTYAARASSEDEQCRASAAFDAAVPTGWRAASPGPAWLMLQAPVHVLLRTFALDATDMPSEHAPIAWRLLGSADGGNTWQHTLSDSSANNQLLTPAHWREQPRRVMRAAPNIPPCNAFKLEMSGASTVAVGLAELQLFGEPGAAQPSAALPTTMLSLREVIESMGVEASAMPRYQMSSLYTDAARSWNLVDLPARGDPRPLSLGFFRGKALWRVVSRVEEVPPAPGMSAPASIVGARGTFRATASVYLQPNEQAYMAFDRNPATGVTLANAATATYDANTGVYRGASRVSYRLVDGAPRVAAGEWLQLRLPSPAQVLSYTLSSTWLPTSFVLLGSNDADDDGSGWDIIDSRSVSTAAAAAGPFYASMSPRSYRAVRLVALSACTSGGGQGKVSVNELRLQVLWHPGVPDPAAVAWRQDGSMLQQHLSHLSTGRSLVDPIAAVRLFPGSTLRLLADRGSSNADTLVLKCDHLEPEPLRFDLSQHPVAGTTGTTWATHARVYDLWPDTCIGDTAHLATATLLLMFPTPALLPQQTDDAHALAISNASTAATAGVTVVTDAERIAALDTGGSSPGLLISPAPVSLTALGASITLAAWVKISSLPSAAGRVQVLDLACSNTVAVRLELGPDGTTVSAACARALAWVPQQLVNSPLPSNSIADAIPLALNTWAHLVVVYNAGDRTLNLYRNGVRACPALVLPLLGYLPPSLWILRCGVSSGGARAQIDNARVYASALSPLSVKALYDFEKANPVI